MILTSLWKQLSGKCLRKLRFIFRFSLRGMPHMAAGLIRLSWLRSKSKTSSLRRTPGSCRFERAEKARKKRFLSRALLEGFREVTLRDDAIETICRKFATVEDFLDAKEGQLETLGISKRIRGRFGRRSKMRNENKKASRNCMIKVTVPIKGRTIYMQPNSFMLRQS